MKTLKESLLSGIDKTLSVDNAYTKIYPTPKVRDFEKGFFGGSRVCWICPGLVQEYINILDSSVIGKVDKTKIIGFCINVYSKFELALHLIQGTDISGSYNNAVDLTGVGSNGASIPTQKKEAIEFFNYIQKNPSDLKRLFEYVNKRQDGLDKNGMCDCLTLKQILKF